MFHVGPFMILLVCLVAIILFVELFLLFTSPYSNLKVPPSSLVHATTGEKIDLEFGNGPPQLLELQVRGEQKDLLRHFAVCMKEQNIRFWAVKSTLLAAVRHGSLIPWESAVSVAIFHDDLAAFVALRPRLEICGDRGRLEATKHGYRYFLNNFFQFPCIDITIMKARDHEISVCTPTDEVGACSFKDSFSRRCEVFETHMVLPFRVAQLSEIEILIPAKAEDCLDNMYGSIWKTLPLWSNTTLFVNEKSKNLMNRFLPVSWSI
jgi:hypothetical protein